MDSCCYHCYCTYYTSMTPRANHRHILNQITNTSSQCHVFEWYSRILFSYILAESIEHLCCYIIQGVSETVISRNLMKSGQYFLSRAFLKFKSITSCLNRARCTPQPKVSMILNGKTNPSSFRHKADCYEERMQRPLDETIAS